MRHVSLELAIGLAALLECRIRDEGLSGEKQIEAAAVDVLSQHIAAVSPGHSVLCQSS